jgi:hypothetical protein
MKFFLSLVISGYLVLFCAIILNVLAQKLGVHTWYDFLQMVSANGFAAALTRMKLLDILFLFAGYPVILGLSAWAGFSLVGYFK